MIILIIMISIRCDYLDYFDYQSKLLFLSNLSPYSLILRNNVLGRVPLAITS